MCHSYSDLNFGVTFLEHSVSKSKDRVTPTRPKYIRGFVLGRTWKNPSDIFYCQSPLISQGSSQFGLAFLSHSPLTSSGFELKRHI